MNLASESHEEQLLNKALEAIAKNDAWAPGLVASDVIKNGFGNRSKLATLSFIFLNLADDSFPEAMMHKATLRNILLDMSRKEQQPYSGEDRRQADRRANAVPVEKHIVAQELRAIAARLKQIWNIFPNPCLSSWWVFDQDGDRFDIMENLIEMAEAIEKDGGK